MDKDIRYITGVYFSVSSRSVYLRSPRKITRETTKCFYTEDGTRFLKSELNYPVVKNFYGECRVEVTMVDGTEVQLKKALYDWLMDAARSVLG